MRWHTVTACCLLASLSLVSGQEAPVQATDEGSVWKDVVRLYEMARDKGEQVPKDVYEWARQDLQRYGTWEYRVVKVSAGAIEKTLNELGTERWECVWIEPAGKQLQLILKRPVRSYLRNLPLSQVLKLVPGAGSGDE